MTFRKIACLTAISFCVLSSQLALAASPALAPLPHRVKSLGGQPWLAGKRAAVRISGRIADEKEHFGAVAGALKMLTGGDLQFVEKTGDADMLVDAKSSMAIGAFVLQIRSSGVRIEAAGLKGLSYATATLLQLIGQSKSGAISPVEIRDAPDCIYRSFMVDVGRNAHSLESLKETIDLLWFYKVDSLQLHLTDDQRFAFPSKAYPKLLTERGKITWDQFAELERYARVRGVAIIPELEVPGHSGILRRTYPEAFGKSPTDLAKSPTARKAIKVLLDEMIELFGSSPYVHIGGDEAYGVPVDLQRALINDLHAYLKSKGKKTIVWEGPPLGKGANKVNTEVIHLNWRTINFPADRMLAAGYPVVNAAWDPLYIVDHYPRNNFTMASPQYIYETLELTKFRHFNPGMPTFARPVQCKPNKRLLGFCMPWWEGRDHNYARMCFPRVIPMAEIAWNHDQKRDYQDFAKRSAAAESVRRRAFYPVEIAADSLAVPEDGVFHNQTSVTLKKGASPGEIRYTLDGSAPAANSAVYSKPLTIERSTIVRAALFAGGKQTGHGSRLLLTCVKPMKNLALGKPVKSSLTSGSPFSIGRLTDGGVGVLDYYLAYPAQPEPVKVTVDLGRPTKINRITVYAHFNNRAYESYRVLVSTDGRKFTPVADRTKKPEKSTAFVNHDFAARKVRYIRVESSGCKHKVFDAFSKLVEIQAFLIPCLWGQSLISH